MVTAFETVVAACVTGCMAFRTDVSQLKSQIKILVIRHVSIPYVHPSLFSKGP